MARYDYDSGMRGRGWSGRGPSHDAYDSGLRGGEGFRGQQGGSWGMEWAPRAGGLPDPYDSGMRGRGSPNANLHGGLSPENRGRGYDGGMRGYDRGFDHGRWDGSGAVRNDLGHARPSEFQFGRGPVSQDWRTRQQPWQPYAGPQGSGGAFRGRAGYGQDYRAGSGYDGDVRGRRWF